MLGSEFNSFSFMGVSNSEMLLSEKDLNACLELNNFLTSNARRPTTTTLDQFEECRIAPPVPLQVEEENVFNKREDREQGQEQQEQQEDKCRFLNLKSCDLKIKLPTKYSLAEFKVEENEDDGGVGVGFKTPKSPHHKIPPVLECPPAPRKPKSFPLMMITKRKLPSAAAAKRRIILHDLSNEIEAMFPPVILADLGNKIKKVRQENSHTK